MWAPPAISARVARLAVRIKLRRCASVGPDTRVLGRVVLSGAGAVHIGARVLLDGSTAPIELDSHPGAEIWIDDDVVMKGGVTIEAQTRVSIGRGSVLGRFATVMDNHFHPLGGDRLRPTPDRPLEIGERVEIGPRAIVLQGAHLGDGARIAAGAVVSRRIKPGGVYPPIVQEPPRAGSEKG